MDIGRILPDEPRLIRSDVRISPEPKQTELRKAIEALTQDIRDKTRTFIGASYFNKHVNIAFNSYVDDAINLAISYQWLKTCSFDCDVGQDGIIYADTPIRLLVIPDCETDCFRVMFYLVPRKD